MSDTPDRTDEPIAPVGPIEPDPIEPEPIVPVEPNFVRGDDDDDDAVVVDDDD